jgi:hypothetical protein
VESLPTLTGSCARGAKVDGGFGLVRVPLTNRYHMTDLAVCHYNIVLPTLTVRGDQTKHTRNPGQYTYTHEANRLHRAISHSHSVMRHSHQLAVPHILLRRPGGPIRPTSYNVRRLGLRPGYDTVGVAEGHQFESTLSVRFKRYGIHERSKYLVKKNPKDGRHS